MICTITALPVRCGDCIFVNFTDVNNKEHSILIDTGYADTFNRTIKLIIDDLQSKDNNLDLLVLTHTDGDHIGGVKRLLKEYGLSSFKEVWFNYSPIPYSVGNDSNDISIKQGIWLRDLLLSSGIVNEGPIMATQVHTISEAILTVISPDNEQFDCFIEEWSKEEKSINTPNEGSVGTLETDYDVPIIELAKKNFEKDSSLSNRSSIAFILNIGTFKALFTGDSHPDVLKNSLHSLGYSPTNPISLNLVKISQHGSKGNTNDDIMDIIDCQHFLISTNSANKHKFPHKEALSRIVISCHNRHPNSFIHFYFTYQSTAFDVIFTDDEYKLFNIICHFPEIDTGGITLTFSTNE
ncbi:ComEC/Rec2 family competence protein [Telluribacter humicola]|uniref:ComEC/Rec2 family competence protein n=1 Tax=Telluribacter humicola TaxID=1720261 RepID=UPI001A963A7D|nr:MBL fold metallo-hydrolase [Telluribacter humicola]